MLLSPTETLHDYYWKKSCSPEYGRSSSSDCIPPAADTEKHLRETRFVPSTFHGTPTDWPPPTEICLSVAAAAVRDKYYLGAKTTYLSSKRIG